MEKVNCGTCRWHNCGNWECPADDCERIVSYSSNHESQKIPEREKQSPSEINANNDCPNWSWNWFGFLSY